MKIIKRDGRIVDYDREKIIIAIEKANNEVVQEKNKASQEDIKIITNYIEKMDKKRILVEDIQDIIEQKLMEIGKYELAKKYIVYRYTRALVRKSNTTDESILGLIRKEPKEITEEKTKKNTLLACTQRNYIAGEVSRDLTKRLLLPDKISKAQEEGILYFHDSDYFVQPIINCCLINIEDMLENGTVINERWIETPKSFLVACTVTTQIIANVASSQYGEQSVDLQFLGKYLRKSKENFEQEMKDEIGNILNQKTLDKLIKTRLKSELSAGVQTIGCQINTFMTTKGESPNVTLILHLSQEDEYLEENALIIEEILNQRYDGVKNEEGNYITPEYPKLIYVLEENNNLKGGKYDYLTKLALQCSWKRNSPSFLSTKKMKEIFGGKIISPMGSTSFLVPWRIGKQNKRMEKGFNQGMVSINLPQIAILSDKKEDKFWNLLEERLELCKEALMCRHYALLGTLSDSSPIHWQYGAISRLKKGEKIDSLLYGENSSLSLGYVGIYEMTKIMKEVPHTDEIGKKFALKVLQYIKDVLEKWKEETNINFTLYAEPPKEIGYQFAKIDQERFGIIRGITDKGYYINSYHIDPKEKMERLEQLKLESEFQALSLGGFVSKVEIDLKSDQPNQLEELLRFVDENILYAKFIAK